MKKLNWIILITAFASTPAFAQNNVANLFSCHEKGNPDFVVNYSSSSFVGKPQLYVQNELDNLVPGDMNYQRVSLSQEHTGLGTYVTAMVNRLHIADAPSTVYQLLIPGVTLGRDLKAVEFETILLIGWNGGFMRPPMVHQRIKSIKNLVCTAELVHF